MRAGWSSILVAAMLLAGCVCAEAQQPKNVPRIGYLSNTDPAGESTRSKAIRVAVQERGYREGQNMPPSPDVRRGGEKSDAISICYTRQSLPGPKRAITKT